MYYGDYLVQKFGNIGIKFAIGNKTTVLYSVPIASSGPTVRRTRYGTRFYYGTGGPRMRVPVRSMNSQSEYRIPIQSFMRDSFD